MYKYMLHMIWIIVTDIILNTHQPPNIATVTVSDKLQVYPSYNFPALFNIEYFLLEHVIHIHTMQHCVVWFNAW